MRTIAFRILKTVLALGALTYLVMVVELAAIVNALATAEWPWILAALGLMPVTLALDGLTWRPLLQPVAPSVTPRELAGAILSGFTLGFVTPAQAGEFVGRALYLPDADSWSVGLTIFVQRLMDSAINVWVGLAALGGALHAALLPPTWGWLLLLAGGTGFGLLLVAFLVAPATASHLARAVLPHHPNLQARIDVLREYAPLTIAQATGWAASRYAVFGGQFLLLVYAFPPSVPVTGVVAAIALTFFIKFLVPSVTLMDLGIQEGAAVFFLSLVGVPEAVAFNAALLLFIINMVVPTAAGVPFVWRLRLADADPTPPPSRR